MMSIYYHNNKTGIDYDVTSVVTSAKWTTKRSGSPASVDLTVLSDKDIVWEHGGIVAIKDDGAGVFYGYIFKLSQSEKQEISITAYDQTRYLKNKETYVFEGKRADQITARIAADFQIKTGTLDNTGYVIPSLVQDNQTLFDIILKALESTFLNSGKMFFLWDDFGSLRISDSAKSKLDLFIGDSSLATGYTYSSDIDSDTYNKIKLVRDNKETGKRDVYIYQDSTNIKFWGILQSYEKLDEKLNEAQIKERGGKMIELYNRPKRSFDVSSISDLTVRAGRVLFIGIADIGIKQFFVVEEASHDLMKKTMSLKLNIV